MMNTILTLWPLAIYLRRNFFGTLPRDMFESAYLDGVSPFTAFFRLVLPLSVPALVSLAIFQFMWVWNDLLVALIFLLGGYPSVAPMTVTISNLSIRRRWLATVDRGRLHLDDLAAAGLF